MSKTPFSASRKVPLFSLKEDFESSNTAKPDVLNSKAVAVIQRVSNKLTGRDFKPTSVLDVKEQVQLLILEATSIEHLCQCYIGWCSFW